MRQIVAAIPFDYTISKNALWGFNQRQGVYLKKEAKVIRDSLTWQIKSHGPPWYDGIISLGIHVQRPDMRGDPINVIDLVADATKVATGIDDRWYAIDFLTWELEADSPMMYVTITQANDEHLRACPECQTIKSLAEFGASKSDKRGHATVCRTCRRVAVAGEPGAA